jgi:hypothetical protein
MHRFSGANTEITSMADEQLQVECRFRLAKLTIPWRHKVQRLPKHFKSTVVRNQMMTPIVQELPFTLSPTTTPFSGRTEENRENTLV